MGSDLLCRLVSVIRYQTLDLTLLGHGSFFPEGILEPHPGMLRSLATGCSGVWSAGPQGLMWLWPVCRYVQHYGLDGASDDIEHVLKRVALRLRKTRKVKVLTGTGE